MLSKFKIFFNFQNHYLYYYYFLKYSNKTFYSYNFFLISYIFPKLITINYVALYFTISLILWLFLIKNNYY